MKVGALHSPGREILVFEIGGRRFALPVSCVKELVRAVATVAVPSAPGVVEGAMNLRGSVVPVLDLRPRLGLAAKAVEPSDLLIIARTRGRLVALRVDRALELVTPETTAAGSEDDGEFAGVARLADGLAPILDPGDLLTESEAEALLGAVEGAGPGPSDGWEAPP